MSDLLSEMESDSFSPSDLPENAELQDVSSIAEKVQQKQKAITTLEQNLKEEKQALLKLTDEDLPSAMAEMNLSSFRLANGSEVSVKNTYGAHIKKENQSKAFGKAKIMRPVRLYLKRKGLVTRQHRRLPFMHRRYWRG